MYQAWATIWANNEVLSIFSLPLLRLRQHREQPVEFVGRHGVVEAPREAPRVDPEILWQVHVPESTIANLNLRPGETPRSDWAEAFLLFCVWYHLSCHDEASGDGSVDGV